MKNDNYHRIIDTDKLYWTPLLDDKNIMNWKCLLPLSFFIISIAQAQWAEKNDNILLMKPGASFTTSYGAGKRAHDPLARSNAPKVYFKTDEDADVYQVNNVSPCLKSVDQSLGNKPFLSLYDASYKASSVFCMETMSFDQNPYSKQYCDNVTSCAKTKLQEIPMGADVGLFIQQLLSEDYIQQELRANIVDMVRFENLLKFMEKKYPNEAKFKCDSRFVDPSLEKSCIYSINNHFMKMQKDCKMPQEFCYANSSSLGQGFIEFEEQNRGGSYSNPFSLFFTQRTDKQVENKVEEDDESLTELLKIFTEKGTDQEKEEKFYAALSAPSAANKYDPITGFFLTNSKFSNRKEEVKRNFGDFVTSALKEKKSLEQLKKDYNNYRLDIGYVLVNEHCKSVPTYDSMCVNSEIIYAGTSERKVRTDKAQTVLKRNEDYGKLDSSRIKQIISFFPKGEEENITKILSKKEVAKVLLESARCETFDFEGDKKLSLLYNLTSGVPDYMSPQTNPELVKMTRLMEGSSAVDSKTRIQQARARRAEFKEKLERESEEKSRKREGRDRSGDHELARFDAAQLRNRNEIPEMPKEGPKLSDVKKPEANQSSNSKAEHREDSYSSLDSKFAPQDFSRFGSQAIQQSPVIPTANQNIVVPQNKETDETSSTSSTTITKSEPIKAPTKITTEPVKEKKTVVAEDNSTLDELKALRNELARLKETTKEPAKVAVAQPTSQSDSKSYLGTDLPNSNEGRKEEAESFHSYSSKSESGNKGSSGSSSSGASSSQASSSSVDSTPDRSSAPTHARSDALRLTSGASGASGAKGNDKFALVLNTQETTVEQNEQAIVDSILESNGKTFEIMMDGVPVKVIPVVEKGKLVFEKGKPKYKIMVRDEKESKVSKTVGDLKIQQEKEVKKAADRAQYIKLKELTKGAIKNK